MRQILLNLYSADCFSSFVQHKFWVERTGVSVVAVAPYYIGEVVCYLMVMVMVRLSAT